MFLFYMPPKIILIKCFSFEAYNTIIVIVFYQIEKKFVLTLKTFLQDASVIYIEDLILASKVKDSTYVGQSKIILNYVYLCKPAIIQLLV